jgi:hypothetical protein
MCRLHSLPDAKRIASPVEMLIGAFFRPRSPGDPPAFSPHSTPGHQLFFSGHQLPQALSNNFCIPATPRAPFKIQVNTAQNIAESESVTVSITHNASQTMDRQVYRPNLPTPLPRTRRPPDPRWRRAHPISHQPKYTITRTIFIIIANRRVTERLAHRRSRR